MVKWRVAFVCLSIIIVIIIATKTPICRIVSHISIISSDGLYVDVWTASLTYLSSFGRSYIRLCNRYSIVLYTAIIHNALGNAMYLFNFFPQW